MAKDPFFPSPSCSFFKDKFCFLFNFKFLSYTVTYRTRVTIAVKKELLYALHLTLVHSKGQCLSWRLHHASIIRQWRLSTTHWRVGLILNVENDDKHWSQAPYWFTWEVLKWQRVHSGTVVFLASLLHTRSNSRTTFMPDQFKALKTMQWRKTIQFQLNHQIAQELDVENASN